MKKLSYRGLGLLCLGLLWSFVSVASAATREVRVPLKNGKLHVADLSSAVCQALDVPSFRFGRGEVKIKSAEGKIFLEAVNLSLGRVGHVKLEESDLVLRVDLDQLQTKCDQMSRAVRVLATESNPRAAQTQATRWGLFAPAEIDPNRPLVVLIHGLDSDVGTLGPMAELLRRDGLQVACFAYAGDQPIDDSAGLLGEQLAILHSRYPTMKIDLVAHSMGGLVARDYVEGPGYQGGVDRMVLVATPNAGSGWARMRFLLSLQEQLRLWRTDPQWSAVWWITEGFGEAGRELTPGSSFLKKMALLQRRAGVRYTIIAGTQSLTTRFGAECFDDVASWIGGPPARWWGFRQIKNGLLRASQHYRSSAGDDDGPVSLSSARLKGVDDVVSVRADHIALFVPVDGNIPAAYPIIRQRLAN